MLVLIIKRIRIFLTSRNIIMLVMEKTSFKRIKKKKNMKKRIIVQNVMLYISDAENVPH